MDDKERNLDEVYKGFTLEQLYDVRKTSYIILIGAIIGVAACAGFAKASDATIFWVCAALLGGLVAIGLKRLPYINARIKELETLETLTLDHSWRFPVHEFYARCKELGITDSHTEFARKKIQNAAKALMTEKGVPEASQEWYIEKAVGYFDAESNRIISETVSEEKRWKTTQHTATLSGPEKSKLNKAEKVKNMYGIEKREFLLLSGIAESKESLSYWQKTEYKPILQKEKDWAVHGGIANGIAGPAAGAVTAAKIMKDNEGIRANNAQMMHTAFLANQTNYSAQARCRKDIDEYEAELKALPEKVILDNVSCAELLPAFQISVVDIHRNSERDDGCMKVCLSIKQVRSLYLDIPDDVKIVLDGTVFGRVYTSQEQSEPTIPSGVEMGKIIVPLDMYGIPYDNTLANSENGKAYTITGLCNRFYGDINTKYVCTLENNHNLWLMER